MEISTTESNQITEAYYPLELLIQSSGWDTNPSTERLAPRLHDLSSKNSVYSGYMPESPSLRMMSLHSPSSIYLADGRLSNSTGSLVSAASLAGLADRLLVNTELSQQDEELRDCFLAIYNEFTNTTGLFHLLTERYEVRLLRCGLEPERVRLRKNMLSIFTNWLNIQQLVAEDSNFLYEMEIFANARLAEPIDSPDTEYTNLQTKINDQLHKLETPLLASRVGCGRRYNPSYLDPATVAEQLTRMESDLFRKILPSDYIAWVRRIANRRPLSLLQFTKNNYKIRDWCQSRILLTRPNQIGLRAQYITYFTRVAEECLQMGSFSTAHAITMGLSSDSVMGLTFTWQLVNKRTKDSLKHISSIVTDTSNYMTNLQSDSQATSVPILTIHLLELRKAHEKLAAYIVEDGEQLINFRAFEELWRNVKEVVKYKVPEGYIPRDPVVSEYLDYAFSQVQDGPDRLLEDRIAKLAREEKWFYKNHRLEPAAAGFQEPGRRPSNILTDSPAHNA